EGGGGVEGGGGGKGRRGGSFGGEREAVLVIERRPFNADRGVAFHKIPFIEIGEGGLRAGVRLFDHDRFESGHVVTPVFRPARETVHTKFAARHRCATHAFQR